MAFSSNTLQFIAEIRPKRRLRATATGGTSLVDQVFLRSFGRVCLVVIPLFFLCCGFLSSMNGQAGKSIASLESENYELLTSNLQFKSEKNALSSLEIISDRAEEYDLYPQEKWQRRIL